MPRADGSIVIDTKLDTKKLEQGISKLSGKLGSAAKSFSGALARGIGVGVAAIAAGVATVSVLGIKLASDLEEVQNVVDTTFGGGADVINKWAKEAGDAFGLSELKAKQFTGAMGAMLKSMGFGADETLDMSTNLAGLAGDMASFYNLDHDEAWEKIRSGISGETEPLKILGINMSEANLEAFALRKGIKKSLKEMSQGEKTLLRYNYLLEATKDAQGDFARTSDSLANQQRILKLSFEKTAAQIGRKLLPGITGLTSGLSDLLSGETVSGLAKLESGFSSLAVGIADTLENIAGPLIEGLAVAIQQLAPRLPAIVTQLIDAIIRVLPDTLPAIVQAFVNLFLSIAQSLPQWLPILADAVLQAIPLIISGLVESLPLLIAGMLKLIESLADNTDLWVGPMIDGAVAIVTTLIGELTSPSTVSRMNYAGEQIGEAILEGICEALGIPTTQLDSIADFLNGLLPKDGLGGSGGAGGSIPSGGRIPTVSAPSRFSRTAANNYTVVQNFNQPVRSFSETLAAGKLASRALR